MIIYLLLYILILLFCFSEKMFSTKSKRILLLGILCVFLCTGYMTGSDWRHYETDYALINTIKDIKDYNRETGFAYIILLAKKMGLDFWVFWILIKIICFFIIIKGLSILTNKNYKWGVLFFYSYFSLFYFIDNPMRNLISATLFIIAYKYIIEKQFLKYLGVIILCSLIHKSALVFIPIYFIFTMKNNLSSKKIIIITTSFYIFMLLTWMSGLRNLLYDISLAISGEDGRGLYYLENQTESKFISLGFIVSYIIFCFILYRRNYIEIKTKYADFLIYGSMIYIITFIIGLFLPILSRFSMFFYVPYIAALSIAISGLYRTEYLIASMTISFFLLVIMYKRITTDFRYIPYSSYIEYIGKPKPSFHIRDSYNPINSPYKTD